MQGVPAPVRTAYYQINGHPVCESCRAQVEASAATPRGIRPLVVAGLFGFGAGLVGAAIYYAVMALAHLEIGLIAILIGYMVGYAVRKGARGRGGLRYQIMAAVLTYLSVAFAYTPMILHAARGRPQALALIPALPVLVVIGSFPSGLISALIIGIGMRQAWKMTAAPVLDVQGPFRVGAERSTVSA